MIGRHATKVLVFSMAIIWFWISSCHSYKASGKGECCIKLPASLQDNRIGSVSGKIWEEAVVGLTTRYDGESVVASLEIAPERRGVFNSSDGGITWRRDPLYYRIHESWLPGPEGHQEIIEWLPNPANGKVKYRTIRIAFGQFRDERSTDGGKTWTHMNFELKGCEARLITSELCYFYHPKDPLLFYVVADLPWRKDGKGMFMTSDGGDSFAFMYECYGTKPILAVSPSGPKVMYASAVMGNIAKSVDAGRTWSPVGQMDLIERALPGETAGAKTQISDIVINPADSNIVYLVASQRILRTQDGGVTWCLLDTGGIGSVGSMAIAPATPNVLLAGTSKGLFRSADAGCHWELVDIKSRIVN